MKIFVQRGLERKKYCILAENTHAVVWVKHNIYPIKKSNTMLLIKYSRATNAYVRT